MNTAIILLLAFLGGSYLWAMRGTILGGQKGAIHPGAFLGLLLPLATGSQYMMENMWVFTAVGGAAMFFGGSQSYGQTLDLAMEKDVSRRTAGRVGVFMKGATWFGIFAGMVAVAFNSLIGEYKPLELVIFVALIPVCKWLGFLVLNSPQKPKKGKFPIFYFSEGRFEMWGGLTFVVLQLIAFAIAKQDWFILTMTLVGFLAGGLGFTIGIIMQNSVRWAHESNRYIFGKLQKAGYVSGWKTMEFTLGGVGGLATVLCFILTYPKEKLAAFEASSGVSAINLSDDTIKWITIGWIVAAAIYCVLSIIPEPPKKVSDIEAKLKSGEISQARADIWLKNASKEKSYAFRNALEGFADEVYHWFVLAYMGILLPMLGCTFVAKVLSVGMIFWVLAEKFIKKGYHKRGYTKLLPLKILMLVAAIAVFALQFATEFANLEFLEFTPFALFAFYLLSYEIPEIITVFGPKGDLRNFKKLTKEGKKVQDITVRSFSWFEIVVCFIIGALIFFK